MSKRNKKILSLLPICLIATSLLVHTGWAANDKGWIKQSKNKGIEVPAPGVKLTPSTVPTHSNLAEGVIWADDANNTLKYYNGSTSVDLGVQAGGSLTLDQAFDNGGTIDNAVSGGKLSIGDGGAAVEIYTGASGTPIIGTDGVADLILLPGGGDVDITGTLDVSGAFTAAGTALSGDLDVTVTDTTANGVYFDGSTITTGDVLQIEYDAATLNGGLPLNITEDTVTVFKVEENGDTTISGTLDVSGLSTLATLTVSTGGLTISAGGLTVTGDNIFTAAATTGNGNYFDGTTVTTGDVVQIEYDATNLNTGLALNITEDTATVFQVAEDGNTTIAGTAAGTTALTITAGDLVMSSGRVDVSGDASNADLLDIIRSNTATGGDAIDINMGSAAQAGDGVDIAWAGAGTGDAINVDMANNVAGGAINIAASGARTGPIIDIANAGTDAGTDDHVVNILQSGSQDSNIVNLAFGTANSPGNAISIDMDTNLAGEGLYIDEGAGARTGSAIEVNADGTGTHDVIDMNVSGSGAITGLNIQGSYNGSPAGNAIAITLDDGDNLDTGLLNLTVGTGNRGALITYAGTGTDSAATSHVMDFNQTGVLDSNIIDITYDTGASTGQAIDINMGTNVAGMAVSIASAATGVDNEGSGIDIDASGALVQGANVLRIDSAGNMAHADCRVVEINETGADQSNSYAMDINSTNNGGLAISSAAADYAILVEQGITAFGGNKLNFYDSAVGMYSQADTYLDIFADGGLRIGDSSGGAPTNYANFASDGSLTLVGTARETKTIWIPAQAFQNVSGAAQGLVGIAGVWQLTDGASDSLTATFYIPNGYVEGTDMTCKIHWSSAQISNTATFDGAYLPVVAGEDTSAAGNLFTQEDDAASGTADYLNITEGFTIGNANIDKGDMVILNIIRLGADGNDDLTDDVDFHGVAITYTADRL